MLECLDHDGKKVLWKVFNNHIVEEPTDHDDIGLRGVDINLFNKDEKG